MLARYAKAFFNRLLTPLARGLLAIGVGPDVITWIGTIGVMVASFTLFARGHLLAGSLVVAALAFADTLDGTMARLSGRSSTWGAFLDSTLDRVADASLFAAFALWFAGGGDDRVLLVVSLVCLAGGAVVSYAKARAEGLGLTCNVGIAERSERLVLALAAAGFAGLFGRPVILAGGLWLLAAATVITIGQRMVEVRRQVRLTEAAR